MTAKLLVNDDVMACCQAAVRRLMGDFGWRLLSEEEFVARAMETLAENPGMKPFQACLNVYSRELYQACQDMNRQEQAYLELHYHLYRIAYRLRPRVVEDATQQALLLIFEQIGACHSPGTFLRFAQWKLRQAIKSVDRPRDREADLPDDEFLWPAPEEPILLDGERADLWDCIRQVWEQQPRARDQLRAVLWRHFDGLTIEEIARRLNKTPDQVYVLISRGLKRLRRCMAERGCAVKGRPPGR